MKKNYALVSLLIFVMIPFTQGCSDVSFSDGFEVAKKTVSVV